MIYGYWTCKAYAHQEWRNRLQWVLILLPYSQMQRHGQCVSGLGPNLQLWMKTACSSIMFVSMYNSIQSQQTGGFFQRNCGLFRQLYLPFVFGNEVRSAEHMYIYIQCSSLFFQSNLYNFRNYTGLQWCSAYINCSDYIWSHFPMFRIMLSSFLQVHLEKL